MERVLADIDTDHGDRRAELLRHGVLLDFGAPGKVRLPVGQEHGRTIPLTDLSPAETAYLCLAVNSARRPRYNCAVGEAALHKSIIVSAAGTL